MDYPFVKPYYVEPSVLKLGLTKGNIFHNTVLKDFPLFCPKCKLTHIIDVEKLEIVIKNTEKQTFII
ncbi:MAG: cysteine-rich KTR domain-containing protein [Candidatus Faecousia sp.]|nr:cysteine-rich KTR domain-containing protein [Candidatus Faecousia sp.]